MRVWALGSEHADGNCGNVERCNVMYAAAALPQISDDGLRRSYAA